jgi:hypothetical protein
MLGSKGGPRSLGPFLLASRSFLVRFLAQFPLSSISLILLTYFPYLNISTFCFNAPRWISYLLGPQHEKNASRGMISMLGAVSTVSALPGTTSVDTCIALTVELVLRLAQYQLSTRSRLEVHFNRSICVCTCLVYLYGTTEWWRAWWQTAHTSMARQKSDLHYRKTKSGASTMRAISGGWREESTISSNSCWVSCLSLDYK